MFIFPSLKFSLECLLSLEFPFSSACDSFSALVFCDFDTFERSWSFQDVFQFLFVWCYL